MQTIIFSKDRTAQLELLLRSIKEQWVGFHNISVLYRASSDKFNQGYNLVKYLHPEFKYIPENNFKQDLLSSLDSDFYKMFLVDDIVFIRNFSLNEPEVKMFEERPEILSLSLRLSPRINYCYTQKKSCIPPQLNNDRTWNWTKYNGFVSDWEYPFSLDGHIYRITDIHEMIIHGNYKAPNTLEGEMDSQRGRALHKPLMCCFEESKIVNIPVNRVQTENANHAGVHHYFGNDFLNDLLLSGKRISTSNIYGIAPNSPHYELPFIF